MYLVEDSVFGTSSPALYFCCSNYRDQIKRITPHGSCSNISY